MIRRTSGPRPGEPSRARSALVLFGLLLACTGALLAARASSSPLVSVTGGLSFAVLAGSAGEWLVHRYVMHRRSRLPLLRLVFELHHKAHHWVWFPPDDYFHQGPVEYASVIPPRIEKVSVSRARAIVPYVVFYSSFAVPLAVFPAWLSGNPLFSAVLLVSIGLEIFLFVHVHDAVHYPGYSSLERFRWFRFLDRHHYLHHVDNRSNTNFLLPLADLLMGTLRLELTSEERRAWPSWEEARARHAAGSADQCPKTLA
jgi:hypothetical protein